MRRRLPLLALPVLLAACQQELYAPDRATRPYPFDLHTTETIDIQVFREGQELSIVNATARSYADFDVWINQRFMHHVDAIAAGETLVLSLRDFHDARGDAINAGGFWRTREPTPVRLVEVQPAPDAPLVGLIAIRTEELREPVAAAPVYDPPCPSA